MIKTNDFTGKENIDLSKEISLVAPTDTPLFTYLMANGKYSKAISKVVTWREKTLDNTADIGIVEGADATVFVNSARAEKNNIMEIFAKNVAISGSALASEIVGISDLMASEVADRLIEMKVAIEKSLLAGELKDGSETPYVRKMKGLDGFVKQANTVKKASLTEKNLKDTLKKLWDNGLGSNGYIALVNADLKETIDGFYKDNYQYVHETNSFGLVVSKIQTNYGQVQFILDRHMANDEILIFDPAFVELAFLRVPSFEKLGKTGDSEKGQVVTEATLKVYNENAVAKFEIGA